MEFPGDIIVNIVSRLPTKFIGRCRCVSKEWKSYLSDPTFIKTHCNRAKQIPRSQASLFLVSFHEDDSDNVFHDGFYTTSLQSIKQPLDEVIATSPTKLNLCYDIPLVNKVIEMVSCDGLILITVHTRDKGKLHLVNPTTQEFKELPYLRPSANPLHKVIYGLGYDLDSDDYKIVAVPCLNIPQYSVDVDLDDSMITFVDVYSIKNGTWKRIDISPYYHYEVKKIVVVNNFVHWIAYKEAGDAEHYVILALGFGKDKASEVPLPSCFNTYGSEECNLSFDTINLVEVGGCLGVYYLKRDWDPQNSKDSVVVWIMREYGVRDSWVKFNIIKGGSSPEQIWSWLTPVCVLGMDQLVLLKKDERSLSWGVNVNYLVSHNLKQGTLRDIILPGMMGEYKVGASFIQTLVSPHKLC